jgi:hypothetical protein
MKPATTPVLMALYALGCAPETIDGVWQFSMQNTDRADDACTETVSHNFSYGRVPTEEVNDTPGWTENNEESQSDQIFFGLITSTGPDAATLIIGTEAYPGVHESDGSWSFVWTAMSSSHEQDIHASGYAFEASSDEGREISYELQLEGDVLTGTQFHDETITQNWTESDSWSADDLYGYLSGDGNTGQIPSYSYLVTDDEDPKSDATIPVYNEASTFDCDDPTCALNRQYSCAESWPIDAVRTTLSTGEDYEGVVGAGQEPGY